MQWGDVEPPRPSRIDSEGTRRFVPKKGIFFEKKGALLG
jgi:hypothetical protein